MGPFLIDSNVIIDYLGARLPEKCLIFMHQVLDLNPSISVICKIETLSFNYNHIDLEHAESFINYLKIIEISEDIVNETINIRRRFKIKTPDAIIAATAKVRNLTLITRNVKDFNKISGLKLYNPWE